MMKHNLLNLAVTLGLSLHLAGCATIGREKEREMNRLADSTVAEMALAYPGLQSRLSSAAGYLVVERSGSGLPMVGRRGKGSLTDLDSGERMGVRLMELEIDGGWGVGDYTALYIFHNREEFGRAVAGGGQAGKGRQPIPSVVFRRSGCINPLRSSLFSVTGRWSGGQ